MRVIPNTQKLFLFTQLSAAPKKYYGRKKRTSLPRGYLFTIVLLYCLIYSELWSAFRVAYRDPELPHLLFPSLPLPPICCCGSIIGRTFSDFNRHRYIRQHLTLHNQTTMITPSQQATQRIFTTATQVQNEAALKELVKSLQLNFNVDFSSKHYLKTVTKKMIQPFATYERFDSRAISKHFDLQGTEEQRPMVKKCRPKRSWKKRKRLTAINISQVNNAQQYSHQPKLSVQFTISARQGLDERRPMVKTDRPKKGFKMRHITLPSQNIILTTPLRSCNG